MPRKVPENGNSQRGGLNPALSHTFPAIPPYGLRLSTGRMVPVVTTLGQVPEVPEVPTRDLFNVPALAGLALLACQIICHVSSYHLEYQ